MSIKNNGGRAGYTAKQFREYYDDIKAGRTANFRILEDTLYQIIVNKGEKVHIDDIHNTFIAKAGKQYDDVSMRSAIQENLKKLCKSGKIKNDKKGYYEIV